MRFKLMVGYGVLYGLLVGISPSWALGWGNEDWKKNGCPENFQGLWVSRPSGDQPQRVYEVGPRVIRYLSPETGTGALAYQALRREGVHYLLELKSTGLPADSFQFPFLKIRPHQVFPAEKSGALSGCYIKVFHYKNRKKAQTEKYEAWDIFKLKPVP